MFGYMFQVKMSDRFLETAERYLNRQNLWEPANDFAAEVGAFMIKDRARGQAVLEEMVHLARQKLDAARDSRGRRRFRHYLGDLANAIDMIQIFSRSWINRHVSSLRPEATPRPEAAEYDPQRGQGISERGSRGRPSYTIKEVSRRWSSHRRLRISS